MKREYNARFKRIFVRKKTTSKRPVQKVRKQRLIALTHGPETRKMCGSLHSNKQLSGNSNEKNISA
jgi:hypothetical protein